MESTHKRLSLRKNFFWSFVGNFVYAGSLWLIPISMTKLLPVEHVGLFILATAIITPIQMFTNLQLRPVQGSDTKNEYFFGEYFALRIIGVFVLLALSVLISMFLQKGVQMILIMSAVVLYKCSDCYADITYGLLQKYERLDKVALSRVVRGILGTAVFITIIWTTKIWTTKNMVLGFLAVSGQARYRVSR